MQRKILIAIILNVLAISATLGIISHLTINESINRSLQDRLTLSRIIADYVDVYLQNNLNRLYDISLSGKIDLKDGDWEPEKKALEIAYRYSIFADGVFLLDKYGNELLSFPPKHSASGNLSYINYVNQVLEKGKPVISSVFTIQPIKKQVIFVLTPLRNKEGAVVGVAGGMLNPTNPVINQLLQTVKIEENSYIEVIDANEVVLASDTPSFIFKHHNHEGNLSAMIREGKSGIKECMHGYSHLKSETKKLDLLAFAPLKIAPWGVIVGQAKEDVFAPSSKLQKLFIGLILTFMSASILFALGVSTSIVKPLKTLTAATNRIALGDLSNPVGDLGSDEVLQLSRSFDDMRERLAASLNEIQEQNYRLGQRVAERTHEIRKSQEKVESLLKKVISSQEEERKRIARELHDTMLQDISAFLINLDICRLNPDKANAKKIDEMRGIVLKTIDGIHQVIQNLRPTILDDLGLDAAITWLLDRHLKDKGITYYLNIHHPMHKRLSPEAEILLFRIIQEAIINIARHTNAENVFTSIDSNDREVKVSIEDDGEGFDLNEMLKLDPESTRGLGILGMKERAALLDGKCAIRSLPGEGTRIDICVPFKRTGGEHVENNSNDRR